MICITKQGFELYIGNVFWSGHKYKITLHQRKISNKFQAFDQYIVGNIYEFIEKINKVRHLKFLKMFWISYVHKFWFWQEFILEVKKE